MTMVTGFGPIANESARILILGSMPGVLSLKANQYYAHPRNAFWAIMAELFKFSAELPYQTRVEILKSSGVAVWDVLHTCVRSGSLDSSIETGSRVPNNFQLFFNDHPNIKKIGFNGAEAERSFNKHVLPNIDCQDLNFIRLPSSSPAHAVSLNNKIELWRQKLNIR